MKKRLLSEFYCHIYLLFFGMWKGECEFRAENHDAHLVLIAAGTGSLSVGTVKLSKVFFNPTKKTIEEITAQLNGWGWCKK